MTRDEKIILRNWIQPGKDSYGYFSWRWEAPGNYYKAMGRLIRRGFISVSRTKYNPRWGHNTFKITKKGRMAAKRAGLYDDV